MATIIVTAYPSDSLVPGVLLQPPNTTGTVEIDFTNVLDSGDQIQTASWMLYGSGSGNVTVNSSSNTPTTATATFGHTLPLGQQAIASCNISTLTGKQDTRSVRLICERL